MRFAILGGPRTGKTTLAEALAAEHGIPVRHTDDLVTTHEWSAASDEVSRWFTFHSAGPSDAGWIVEGVAAARALRKFLAREEHAPCDVAIVLTKPRVTLTSGQSIMAKGHETVLRQILPELERRGVRIDYRE